VPDEAQACKKGAIAPWAKSNPPSPYYMQTLKAWPAHYGFSLKRPVASDLPARSALRHPLRHRRQEK
jgi:excinuclease ABC subunit A